MNLNDLNYAIHWFNRNGFKPQDMGEFLQYECRVRYYGYVLTAGPTYEWSINVEWPFDGIPPHNALYHTKVAPWVIDHIKLAVPEEEWKI